MARRDSGCGVGEQGLLLLLIASCLRTARHLRCMVRGVEIHSSVVRSFAFNFSSVLCLWLCDCVIGLYLYLSFDR